MTPPEDLPPNVTLLLPHSTRRWLEDVSADLIEIATTYAEVDRDIIHRRLALATSPDDQHQAARESLLRVAEKALLYAQQALTSLQFLDQEQAGRLTELADRVKKIREELEALPKPRR